MIQATKSGQLILLDRLNGKPLEKYVEKIFYHSKDKVFLQKSFENWLQFSKNNFKDDINSLSNNSLVDAKSIISKSIIYEYQKLSYSKIIFIMAFWWRNEWPGIGVSSEGNVIIPGNNIAWVSKLRDPSKFNFSWRP